MGVDHFFNTHEDGAVLVVRPQGDIELEESGTEKLLRVEIRLVVKGDPSLFEVGEKIDIRISPWSLSEFTTQEQREDSYLIAGKIAEDGIIETKDCAGFMSLSSNGLSSVSDWVHPIEYERDEITGILLGYAGVNKQAYDLTGQLEEQIQAEQARISDLEDEIKFHRIYFGLSLIGLTAVVGFELALRVMSRSPKKVKKSK